MGTSKQLVTALEQTDWLDRVLIISALIFFGLVVLFVLKQRILDRGLRIAFWWTKFIPGIDGTRGQATGEMSKEVVVDRGISLTSIAVTATAIPSTLASVLAATATPSSYTEDGSYVGESMVSSSIISASTATADPAARVEL